jgi:DNA-damage-inducible protein D
MNSITVSSNSQENSGSPFDSIRGYRANGSEFWTARELTKWLGYAKWENAEKAIKRAIVSCKNQGFDVTEHFPEVGKLSNRGKGAVVEIKDVAASPMSPLRYFKTAKPAI